MCCSLSSKWRWVVVVVCTLFSVLSKKVTFATLGNEENEDLAPVFEKSFSEQLCEEPPPPFNGDLHCGQHKKKKNRYVCKTECNEGFQFPNGKKRSRHFCDMTTGQWTPEFAFPDCQPICEPSCQNSGECMENNHCICTPAYRGTRCEYNLNLCDPTIGLHVSADWSCNHTSSESLCAMSCPHGTRYESPPARLYTCSQDGTWTPKDAPKCLSINIMEPPSIPALNSLNLDQLSSSSHSSTCATWSGSHYRTFDGGLYSVWGTCTYLLAKDCSEGSFTIHLKHNSHCQTATSCPLTLILYLGTQQHVLLNTPLGPAIEVDGQTHRIPTVVDGLLVQMVSDYVTVTSSLGFKLKWDQKNSVLLTVSEQLRNKTCGLCGRFDGTVLNDFETPDGILTDNVERFVDSWTMDDLNEKCEGQALVKDPCAGNASKLENAEEACNTVYSEKFKSCHSILDPKVYYEACKMDHCECGDNCRCNSLSEYFKECSRLGGKVEEGWRSETLCPLICPSGMIYGDCGSSCPKTCKGTVYDCEDDHCVDGCHCPEDTVLHDGQCIRTSSCPCLYKGVEHQPGERILQECNACECNMGKWECTKQKCDARCSSTGDPHYTTFDGMQYEFLGTCPYYLVLGEEFSIVQEIAPCSQVLSEPSKPEHRVQDAFCTQSVQISYNDSTLQMKTKAEIRFNEREIVSLPLTQDGFMVYMATSMFVKVDIPNDMSLLWDGHNRIYIDAPATMEGHTKGLCGTFNRNQNDDFMTPEGDIEADVSAFAARWKASDSCHKRSRRSEMSPCQSNPQNMKDTEVVCSVLKSDVFEDCQPYVDPEIFYRGCVADLCVCSQDLPECLCPILGDYSSSCSRQGIVLNWIEQVEVCKPKCSGGQEYSECANPCTSSCSAISSSHTCITQCVQGCACPNGMTLSSEGICIPLDQCPCVHQGKDYSPGSVTLQGTSMCECVNALWRCRPASSLEELASPHFDLTLSNDIKNCDPGLEEFTSCMEECPKSCQNLHLPAQCKTKACKQGCRCKTGYVLDTDLNRCVELTDCGCHHGGHRYTDGETVKRDCNKCTCDKGTWQCTDFTCTGTCSTWGESHFKTFDGKVFDFQGDCEYIMAQGNTTTDFFKLSLENVPCGTSSVTCGKAFTLEVSKRNHQGYIKGTKERIVIRNGYDIPKTNYTSAFVVLDSRLHTFILTTVGVTVMWDKRTRLYLTLDPVWRSKVQGLCGNYNDDQQDDFLPPWGGVPESTPTLFAKTWKVREYCPEPVTIKNSCAPDRETWAHHKCGILKSDLFAPCHSEVTSDLYYERCILDTCACMEGDNKCLCTAIAAYAYECGVRGVPVKWRSQEFCPIQCEDCATYDSCIPACPPKTCQTQMQQEIIEETCPKDICVEGCIPKPCPDAQIFNNTEDYKCIPIVDCVVPCLRVNGKMYYEGERVVEPEVTNPCQSCHCRRGAISCSGIPCPVTIPRIYNISSPCTKTGWTPWMNTPAVLGGDFEILDNPLLVSKIGDFCGLDNVTSIECRVVKSKVSHKESGQDVVCDLSIGFVCEDGQQEDGVCEDYEIRLFCNCGVTTTTPQGCSHGWTEYYNVDHPTPDGMGDEESIENIRKQHDLCIGGTLEDVECKALRDDQLVDYSSTGQFGLKCSKNKGFICNNYLQPKGEICLDYVVRFFCSCEPTTISSTTTLLSTTRSPSLTPVDETCGWTPWLNVDRPENDIADKGDIEDIGLLQLVYRICGGEDLIDIECRIVKTQYSYEDSLQKNLLCDTENGFRCYNKDQTESCYDYEVRVLCLYDWCRTTTSPNAKLWETTKNPCPNGQVYDDCAYNCNQTCSAFAYQLSVLSSKCSTPGNVCVPGCRPAEGCHWPNLWRDHHNCVPKDECTCVYPEGLGRTVAPHDVIVSGCEKCQCLDNDLMCYRIPGCGVSSTTAMSLKLETTNWTPPVNITNGDCWTDWVSIDTPFTGAGDFESMSALRQKYEFCRSPVRIKCRPISSTKSEPFLAEKTTQEPLGFTNATERTGKDLNQPEICSRTGWTPWMSQQVPDDQGETERLEELRANYLFCSEAEIEAIECRGVADWKYVSHSGVKGGVKGGTKPTCDKKNGYVCKGPKCKDHELRVYCKCGHASRKKRETVSNQAIQCNLRSGLACWNSDNIPEGCLDYEVRFFCPCPTQEPATTTTPPSTVPPAPCSHGWTEWYNSHVPDQGGEYETVQSVRAHGGYFCDNHMITAMECKPASSNLGTSLQRGVVCDPSTGLICKNRDLGGTGSCFDYVVRFFCDCPTKMPVKEEFVTTETLPPTRLPQLRGCAFWSDWINENHPVRAAKTTVKGARGSRDDAEKGMLLRMQQETGFCLEGRLSDIECRDAETDADYSETDNGKLVCSLAGGFRCRAKEQPNKTCRDYKIRYFCECEESTTTILLRPTLPTLYIQPCEDYYDIIDGPNPLPDSSLTASSSIDSHSGPQSARMSSKASLKSAGAWIAGILNDHQYLEVDMGTVQPVYGIVTTGRDGSPQWVKSYKVLYSRNGLAYAYVSNHDAVNSDKIFSGNYDSYTPVEHIVETPFEARFVRIQPITFHKEIALRMDILGCSKNMRTESVFSTEKVMVCRDEMGLSNGDISDRQILASSERNINSGADRARLNIPQSRSHSGGWVAKYLDDKQFIQVDLRGLRTLTGVITQGRDVVPQFVTAYTVSYSNDGLIWNDILDDFSEIKVFPGNYDSDTPETSYFSYPIRARFIRVHPLHWDNWIAMRLEILGCYEPYALEVTSESVLGETIIPTAPQLFKGFCEEPMGFESGELPDELISVSSSANPWSGADRIRLNTPADASGTGGWVAATADHKPVIEIDFYDLRNLTGILTQGRADVDMWIMSYTIEYSSDNVTWTHTADSITKNSVFAGNYDRNTAVLRLFTTMITARFLKITILDYHTLPALRMEILGCFKPYVEELPPTPMYITPTEYCIEYGPWLSLSDPATSYLGDEEPIDKIIALSRLCNNPLGIQCREMLTRQDHTKTGQVLNCDLETGLLCKSHEQYNGHCYNYEVRIKCWSCGGPTTPTPLPLQVCPELPEYLEVNCPASCDYVYQACDGSKCVSSVDCPCFREGHRFNPGDVLVTEECQRCECSIEGHSKCKPIQCNSRHCQEGQISKLNKHCECECVGCPFGTVQCPSNGQCVKEEMWCDGVVDCPDDEKDCPTSPPPETTVTPSTTEAPFVCSTDLLSYTDTCYMVANTFQTFDGLSYQYDICDHVLMKERYGEVYYITVHKSCLVNDATKCRKFIIIKVDDFVIQLGPENYGITINDTPVPLSNLWLVSKRFLDFELKKEGNHLLFRSFKYDFDVRWSPFQDVIITASKCDVDRVVGLCGLYNQKLDDDHTMPSGELATGIEAFGDSWSTGSRDRCLTPKCPLNVMTKAAEVCDRLVEPPFDVCAFEHMNQRAWVEACMSHMCDCLQLTLDARSSAEKDVFEDLSLCQCSVYESFVEACESEKQRPIAEWRIQNDCTPDCPPELEYLECGPGCDLTCDNYPKRSEICSSKTCIPGCYCPPGLIHHHNRCVKPKMCQDCVCRGHGDPNYITFDGRYFAFQGNCTYVLAQHLTSNQDLNFQVLSTNYECPEEPGTSCTEGLEVIWNGVSVKKFYNQPVYLNGVPLREEDSPFDHDGIGITFVPGKSTIIHIQEINLVVRYFDQMYGFNVELPAHIYFNATEGLCGICNSDVSDDLYHRSGFITEDIEDFAYSWLHEGYMRPLCTFPREPLPSPPPFICNFTANPCELFLNPDLYAKSCNNDVSYSRNPDASMCRSKFQYAQQCCERGVSLVDWLLQSGCDISCPEGMQVACSSACPVTCDNYKTYQADDCDLMNLFTCECPPGQVFKQGHCVDVIKCQMCDAEGHVIGDTWSPDKCKKCECMADLSVSCTVTQCPEPPTCLASETLTILKPNLDIMSSECCTVYQCKAVERKECPSVPEPECEPGESKVLTFVDECPVYACECKSLLCPPQVKPTAPREEGEQYMLEKIGCCQQYVSKCFPETCGSPSKCGPGFKLVTYEGKCCTHYNCIRKEEVCLFQHKYMDGNGTSIPLPLEEYYDAEYEDGASWTDGPCTECTCTVSDGAKVTCKSHLCLDPADFPDADKYVRLEEYVPGACCPIYHRIKCKSNGKVYSNGESWSSPDGDKCKAMSCLKLANTEEVIIAEKTTVCDKTCPGYAVYEEAPMDSPKCCGHCKPIACEEDGIIYQAGDTWDSSSKPCFNAQCLVSENASKIAYKNILCPVLAETCPKENIVTDRNGCCTYCKTLDSCNPIAIPEPETVGFFHLVDKERGVCSNTKSVRNLTKCIGQCDSKSFYSTLLDNFESSCKCCLPMTAEKRNVILDCENGTKLEKIYQQPTTCMCSSCSENDRGTIELPPPY